MFTTLSDSGKELDFMEERRVLPRLSMQIPVVLIFPETGLRFNGRTRDISASGVFFYAGAPVVEQQNVEILMTFSSDITSLPIQVSCKARVMRVERESEAENTGIAIAIRQFNFLHGETTEAGIPFHITKFSGSN
jgi:hypothetical protein